jgi:hypothetical protein
MESEVATRDIPKRLWLWLNVEAIAEDIDRRLIDLPRKYRTPIEMAIALIGDRASRDHIAYERAAERLAKELNQ